SLRTGEVYEIEYRLRGSSGTYRWFIARGLPIREAPDSEHPEGRIARWYGTCTDIEDIVQAREVLTRSREELEGLVAARTAELRQALHTLHREVQEHERTEAALRQAQKMEAVGQLTGGVAHDFNNMLQGIAGSLETVRRRVAQGRLAEVERYLDLAGEAVNRAAGLTRRLLAFARRQRLEPKPIDPKALIAGMADLIRRAVGPGIKLELQLPEDAGRVVCDANELESALLNLCLNARDAMREGGRLTLGTEEMHLSGAEIAGHEGLSPGNYTVISVADTGEGMSAHILDRVYEPFFTTKLQGEGTGLGLSQVYGFVRQSGGLVRLDSAPGQGTTALLFLPRHEGVEATEERTSPLEPEQNGGSITVLLVDDEEAVRRPALERLRDLGYRVLEAADGPAAMRLVEDGTPVNLLITDVGLPGGMNGRQVADGVRERVPGVAVLFMSGYAGDRLPPGTDVIGKPFGLDDLARRGQGLLKPDERAGHPDS
ncbi:MAG: response regulator, partial [Acetobacteraceae bacterium]|nr:response regulator [Acetobacteraceae bacterium]